MEKEFFSIGKKHACYQMDCLEGVFWPEEYVDKWRIIL